MTVLFNIFMRQTLTDDFWGLHKNINCAFPLSLIIRYNVGGGWVVGGWYD